MIDISNLIKYSFGLFGDVLDEDVRAYACEDGKFVKFEDVVELLKRADNTQSVPLKCPVHLYHDLDSSGKCDLCQH